MLVNFSYEENGFMVNFMDEVRDGSTKASHQCPVAHARLELYGFLGPSDACSSPFADVD